MNEKISIIVPVYNVCKYLDNCLTSIINQTYKNIEVILIDDGSKDASQAKCEEYVKKDNRFKLRTSQHKGVSSARNIGVDIAEGEYVIFIDADDWLEPNMIEELYANLKKYDCDVSICEFYLNMSHYQKNHNDLEEVEIITDRSKMYEYLFNDKLFAGYIVTKLIKRNKIANIRFDCNIKLQEDTVFLSNVFENVNKIIYMPNKRMYHYKKRGGSAIQFDYSPKDFTKLLAFEKFMQIKSKYNVKALDKIEYRYYTLARQGKYIFFKSKTNDQEINEKIKYISKNYLKIALHEANAIQKIRVILLTCVPILYGALKDGINKASYWVKGKIYNE